MRIGRSPNGSDYVTDDATGDAIEGATVEIESVSGSVVSDANGMATLSVNASATGGYPIDVMVGGYSDGSTILTVQPDGAVSKPDIPDVNQELSNAVAGDDDEISLRDVRSSVSSWNCNGQVGRNDATLSDLRTTVQYWSNN